MQSNGNRDRAFTMSHSGLLALHPRLDNLPPDLDSFMAQVYNMGAGVEIEAEMVEHCPALMHHLSESWNTHEDPSLRGASMEFVTPFGVRMGTALQMVRAFFDADLEMPSQMSFGERTSIHVHLDVRMFSKEQLTTLVKLYVLCEDSLFQFVGGGREHNIYCVPLNHFLPHATKPIRTYFGGRNRYGALNLASLEKYGTIEFRQLGGTNNVEKVISWMLLAGSLVRTAFIVPESSLNSWIDGVAEKRSTADVLHEIFRQHALWLIPVEGDRAEELACSASLIS